MHCDGQNINFMNRRMATIKREKKPASKPAKLSTTLTMTYDDTLANLLMIVESNDATSTDVIII